MTVPLINIVCFSDSNYEYQIENLLQSLDRCCLQSIRILYYTVGFESTIVRSNLVKIPWPVDSTKPRMEFYKPEILLDSLARSGGHFVYLDSDIIVSSRFDPNALVHTQRYPIASVGNWDSPYQFRGVDITAPFPVFEVGERVMLPDYTVAGPIEKLVSSEEAYLIRNDDDVLHQLPQKSLLDVVVMDHNKLARLMGVRGKIKYVSSCFVSYGPFCRQFMLDWKALLANPELLAGREVFFPFHDETALNVLLWRYGATQTYDRIFLNTNNAEAAIEAERCNLQQCHIADNSLQYCHDSSTCILYHGIKDPTEAAQLLAHLQQQGRLPHYMQRTAYGLVLSTQQRPEALDYFWRGLADENIARILEIGTAEGGLSVGLRNLFTKTPIRTVDIYENPWTRGVFANHNIQYQTDGNYTSQDIADWVRQPGRSVVLCDGGAKIREFQHFASIIKPGDLLLAHDYTGYPGHLPWGCVETPAYAIAKACADNNLANFKPELFGVIVWAAKIKLTHV
jgi:hypothetical protein